MLSFLEKCKIVEGIDGMLSPFSAALLDALSMFQVSKSVTGNILEFGCYKGKTTMAFGLTLLDSEKIYLVDSIEYLESKSFELNNVKFEFSRQCHVK